MQRVATFVNMIGLTGVIFSKIAKLPGLGRMDTIFDSGTV
jgi:hypothetical protein